jgi:uncharacterized Zn finger protein (UPF0148 family)
MAKKMKPGQKRCPSCGTSVSGPRTKTCPKCGHEFNGKPQEAPVPKASPATAVPAVVEKPATSGGTITLDQVKKVAQTVKTLGGVQRMTEVLEVIKELGGVKKFKELAEAISATSMDDIPF